VAQARFLGSLARPSGPTTAGHCAVGRAFEFARYLGGGVRVARLRLVKSDETSQIRSGRSCRSSRPIEASLIPGGQRSGDGVPTRRGHVIEVVSCVPDGDGLHHLGGSNRPPAETARSV
jgi:hypothetical protein